MSQDFKLKFDEMREGDPGKKDAGQNQSFASPGHVRNLCFVWPDGKMKFLNYAYLVSGEYLPDEIITLIFTSNTVFIKGSVLEALFEELVNHIPKRVICTDERYNQVQEPTMPIINEIQFIKNS